LSQKVPPSKCGANANFVMTVWVSGFKCHFTYV
jgi:hypothetical protein